MPAILLNRRVFLTGIGCAGFAGAAKRSAYGTAIGVHRSAKHSGPGIALPAIASASMPEVLILGGSAGGRLMRGGEDFQERLEHAGYIEHRIYHVDRGARFAQVRKTFAQCGIVPLLSGTDGSFLFAFETLASREKAWRELSAKQEWQKLSVHLRDLAIYEVPKFPI